MFQSHYGAIGTELYPEGLGGFRRFQSHYGAIGTIAARLAAIENCRVSIPLWCDWNDLHCNAAHVAPRVSIPLWCDWNPVLVELTDDEGLVSIPLWCDWNREAGPSGEVKTHVSIPLWCDWNPDGERQPCSPPGFQSHYGAIGTVYRPRHQSGRVRFQSHYGAIGTRASAKRSSGRGGVSIPLWCDWNGSSGNEDFRLPEVSIPLWCDWNSPRAQRRGEEDPFQSHYGAIGTSYRSGGDRCGGHAFQSHYGAIGTASPASKPLGGDHRFNPTMVRLEPRRSTTNTCSQPVSIPLWCDWNDMCYNTC